MDRRESALARLQARFAAGLLTAGDNPVALFREDGTGDPERTRRRFALYRGNLVANWEKALANAYPVLKRLVGNEFFRALAREYGRAMPLEEGDLNAFGRGLASFLDDFAPVAEYPYMADMARLEWALHLAYYGADEASLSLEALAAMDAETLDGLRLRLRQVCTLIQSRWAVVGIWQAHQQPGQAPAWPADIRRPSQCLICRPRWRAELLELSPGELAALRAITEGAPLGAGLETGADADPTFDPAAALPRWLQSGIFNTIQS